MLRDVVQNTFQRATVSADYDELTVSVGKLRVHINDLRVTLRETLQEMERLRAEVAELRALREEVAALKAGGLVVAPAAAPAPAQAPAATPASVAPSGVGAAPATGNGLAHVTPIRVPDEVLSPAPAAGTPVTLAGLAAAIAQESAGNAPVAVDDGPIIRIAADGVAYWGPVDNASSRARAAGKKLIIDQPECISCGTCVEQTDTVFVLPDDSKAVAKVQEGPMDAIQDAIDACPVTCIHWTDNPGQFQVLNDETGFKLA